MGGAPDTTMVWVNMNEDAEVFWDTNRNGTLASAAPTSASTPRTITVNPGTNMTMVGVTACFQ